MKVIAALMKMHLYSLINYLSNGEVNVYCGVDRNISRYLDIIQTCLITETRI